MTDHWLVCWRCWCVTVCCSYLQHHEMNDRSIWLRLIIKHWRLTNANNLEHAWFIRTEIISLVFASRICDSSHNRTHNLQTAHQYLTHPCFACHLLTTSQTGLNIECKDHNTQKDCRSFMERWLQYHWASAEGASLGVAEEPLLHLHCPKTPWIRVADTSQ